MNKGRPMATYIIIGGVLLIALGTLLSLYGQSLRNSQGLTVLRKESALQNESLKQVLHSQEKQISELTTGNKVLLSNNESLKHTIDVQTSLINELQGETGRLRNMGDIQLKTTYYTEELNQEVKAIFIRFKLKESADFNSLCPFKFGFEFSSPSHTSLSFNKTVTDTEQKDNNNNRLCAYKVYDLSPYDKPIIKHEFYDYRKTSNISDLTIQVFVTSGMKGSIRDFHDEVFAVKFPKNLYQIIESVQLIVNGWIILDENFNKVDWIIVETPWLNFITPEVTMYRPINKGHPERPPSTQWIVNLYDKLPMYAKELSSTQWVGSLADELRMLRR